MSCGVVLQGCDVTFEPSAYYWLGLLYGSFLVSHRLLCRELVTVRRRWHFESVDDPA
jgi:hypothetical protein